MKVTIERIESLISSCFFVNAAMAASSEVIQSNQIEDLKRLETTTLCFLVLKNGYTLVGKSACADPAEYKEEVGKKFAREDAVRQIWALEGYLLKQCLFEEKSKPLPNEQALINLRNAKDGAGRAVILGPNPINGINPDGFKQSTRDFAAMVLHPGAAFINFGGTSKAAEVAAWRNLGLLAAATAAVIEEGIGVKNEQ